ncbi:glycoside hydrolase family 99-like domain-containing protein [Candidatus Bipolaricaulota bacterium]|nr:glycoside hydrolase family 99-like domain-containing protein [Candidatus Bipolaricaulota bacterium]
MKVEETFTWLGNVKIPQVKNATRKKATTILVITLIVCTLTFISPADLMILANEKKITVPIDQVVKTDKLSAKQLTKQKVTVPVSWVSEEYLEEEGYAGKESSPKATEEPDSAPDNVPDGTYTREPKITLDQTEAIEISDFYFEFSYDQGNLQDSTVNFTINHQDNKIDEVKLLLNGEKQLSPEGGAQEEFSHRLKNLNEGNLYEGQLKFKREEGSELVRFQVYPREFLNIADDDEIKIAALYNIWYASPGSSPGVNWEGRYRSVHQPKIGEYSSKNDEVVAKHIDWATGHGIDAFMINWWGNSDMKKRLQEYLDNPLSDEIDYFILWDVHSSEVSRTESGLFDFSEEEVTDKFMQDMEYITDHLIDDQNYFELKNKPVIYLYDEDDFTGPFKSYFNKAEEMAEATDDIFWIGDNSHSLSSSQKMQREAVDGITDFNPLIHWFDWVWSPGKDWELTQEEIKKRYVPQTRENYFDAQEMDKDYIPTIIPGFNKPASDLQVVKRNEEGFRYEIEKAKELLDQKLKAVLITSFNGWLEDHEIEPSKSWGNTYLEIVKEELAGYTPKKTLKDRLDHLEFRFNKYQVPESSDNRKLTMRPAWFKFYSSNSISDPEFTLDLDTDQALEHMGRGWSIPAEKGRFGSGKNKKSSIYIPKFEDLRYLKMNAIPISGDIEADVYLNGELVDHIDFEEGWQTYTVELSK